MEHQPQTTRADTRVSRAPDRPTSGSGSAASAHPILALQRRVGNQAAARIVQAKLRVGPPGDVYEQEADRVADDVMRMPEGGAVAGVQRQSIRAVQAKCADCEREERETARTLRRAPAAATEDDRDEEREEGAAATPLAQREVDEKEGEAVPPRLQASAVRAVPGVSPQVESRIDGARGAGHALSPGSRAVFESRFGSDFSGVRVHTDSRAAGTSRELGARAFTVGPDIFFGEGEYRLESAAGRRLLAHELTHVVQQDGARALGRGTAGLRPGLGTLTAKRPDPAPPGLRQPAHHGTQTLVQRAIMLTTSSAGRHRMLARERAAFIARYIHRGDRPLAQRVLDDMDAAGDTFDFADERELELELVKRVETSQLMRETQVGPGRTAFGYPFSPPAELYGPRVNYAARTYWTPPPPDSYADRSRDARAARARSTPRGNRHSVFGDMPPHYVWSLTPAGIADFHQALSQLFVPQPQPYRRSLLHCDYLVSLVHFRALATAIGATRFNAAARAYGAHRLRLRWNLYADLYADNFSGFRWWLETTTNSSRAPAAALGSLAQVRPSSISDLVIGDHVIFWNHKAYDALNERIGNAWRLENAVLIDRRGGRDLFLGHGSGTKTERQMREKLAGEYNQVADIALGLVSRTRSGPAGDRAAARAELSRRFPRLEEEGGRWWIREGGVLGFFRSVNQPLSRITASDVPGLHDPNDPSRMNLVRRPAESRR